MGLRERARLHGRVTLTTVDPAWLHAHRADPAAVMAPPGRAVRRRVAGDNVICTAGLYAVASSLMWAGIQDQAGQLGVTAPSYLTPLYGAVGDGSGTPAAADVGLFSELARQTVGAGAASPATPSIDAVATWLFYFPNPPASWQVTEAGVFALATAVPGSGAMLDHYAFPAPLTVTTADSLILQVALSVAGG